MKAVVNAKRLRDALSQAVAEQKSTLEILKHAIVEARDDGVLALTTTDISQMLCMELEAEVSEPGTCTAEASLLRAALNGLDGDVTLRDGKGDTLSLSQRTDTGTRSFRFPSLPVDDMPLPDMDEPQALEIGADLLLDAIQSVHYCAAKDDARVFMNGVSLYAESVFATDGHRLAAHVVGCAVPEIIIPRPSLPALLSALTADGVECFTLKAENCSTALMVKSPGATYLTRLIDSKPVDYRRMVPDISDAPYVVVDAKNLKAALERVMALSPDAIELAVKESRITLCGGKDRQWSDYVTCNQVGDDFTIGVNPKYLRDVLAHGDKSLVWHCVDSEKGQHFAFDESDVSHVVMPLRR